MSLSSVLSLLWITDGLRHLVQVRKWLHKLVWHLRVAQGLLCQTYPLKWMILMRYLKGLRLRMFKLNTAQLQNLGEFAGFMFVTHLGN